MRSESVFWDQAETSSPPPVFSLPAGGRVPQECAGGDGSGIILPATQGYTQRTWSVTAEHERTETLSRGQREMGRLTLECVERERGEREGVLGKGREGRGGEGRVGVIVIRLFWCYWVGHVIVFSAFCLHPALPWARQRCVCEIMMLPISPRATFD